MDQSILQRVAAGDPAAVSACVDRYGGLIWSLARRMLRERSEAEDAVQDVFIALWQDAGRFNPQRSSEITFVTVIARRRIIDRLRRAARRPPALSIDGYAAEPTADDTTATAASRCEEARRAAAALAELRPDERQAVHLAIVDGLTHNEISSRLGLPLGTVKTHIRRGLQKVRDKLTARAAAVREVTS